MAPQREVQAWAGASTTPRFSAEAQRPQSLLVPARGARVACWRESALLPDCRRLSPAGEGTAPPRVESRAQFQTPYTAQSGVCVCKVRRKETAGISGFF